jgi:hypothetical protein
MDFNLTREQELVRKMMRGFAETEIKPIAAETDKTAEYPRETIEKLFDYGVMGMAVPKGVRRRRRGRHCRGHRHRGDLQAVRIHRRHRRHPQRPLLRPHPGQRHRGAEEEVPGHADQGPQGRRVLPDRAQRRLRRIQGLHHRQAGGRSLRAQRLQDLHHPTAMWPRCWWSLP